MNHAAKARLRVPTAASEDAVGAQWNELRAKPLRRRVEEATHVMPPVEPVIKWTLRFHDEGKRPGMLVVPGATAHDRMGFYRKYLSDEWASFRPETVEDVIGDPARDWVDQTILTNF